MKDIKVVEEKLYKQGINPDIAQIAFLEAFIQLETSYKPKTFFF